MQINFISGLPRSGSTLLAAILRQNPEIHASMSSPVSTIFQSALSAMGLSEFAGFVNDKQRAAILKSVICEYYRDYPPYVFDTSRAWTARMGAILSLFPDARVVACVRDAEWIADSFEKMLRKNPLIMSRMFAPEMNTSVFARCDAMANGNGQIGLPFNSLQEAFFGEHADRLVLVDYNYLVSQPQVAMRELYEALNLTPFDHDFENVNFDGGQQFDEWIGVPGLHTIRPRVELIERDTILPPEIFNGFKGRSFWKRSAVREKSKSAILSNIAPPIGDSDG